MADTELGPSYLRIATEPPVLGESKRQVQVSGAANVDVSDDGRVLGVECLDGPVGLAALFDALRGIRVAQSERQNGHG